MSISLQPHHQEGMLPVHLDGSKTLRQPTKSNRRAPWSFYALVLFSLFALSRHIYLAHTETRTSSVLPVNAGAIHDRCNNLKLKPGPPSTFHERKLSDRFVAGTKPTLIRNATIWTGRINGLEVIRGDILLDKGLIQALGRIPSALLITSGDDLVTIDAKGAWVSPG